MRFTFPSQSASVALWVLTVLTIMIGVPSSVGAQQSYTASLDLIADGFTHPLMLTEPPDGSSRLFVLDQPGEIWVIAPNGTRLQDPFLDIGDRVIELNEHYDERGLLGLAFHPDFAQNGLFYVFYSAPLRDSALDSFDHTNRLSEFRVSAQNPNTALPGSERILLEIDHPYMNHNAGTLAFGPDGYLYVALGDGGNRDDQDVNLVPGHVEDWYEINAGGNGQDIENNLLGSILRIDVDAEEEGKGYSVPDDNPFRQIPGALGEIYAYGFRNPYRFSFDLGGNNELIVGDAAQDMFEEISVVEKGGNYGWNVMEGRHCFNAASPTQPLPECPEATGVGHPVEGDPLIAPVIEAKNSGYFPEEGIGLVIVGGYVYRGDELPSAFQGKYIFGSYSRGERHTPQGEVHEPGRMFVADRIGASWPFVELAIAGLEDGDLNDILLSFGQDREGNVYVLTAEYAGPRGNTGKVYRLTSAP